MNEKKWYVMARLDLNERGEAVLGVGPRAPATKRGLSGVLYLSHAVRAICAEARFISIAKSAMS